MNNHKTLTLLGKVDRRILKKMNKEIPSDKKNTWYFIDYASHNIKLGEGFDVILEGVKKTLIPEPVSIEVKEVYDQFGTKIKSIPKGFQTIVNLSFSNKIPIKIDNLPTYSEWIFNSKSITLAKHEDIKLQMPEIEVLIYKYLLNIISKAIEPRNNVQKKDVVDFLISKIRVSSPTDAIEIINKFKILGLAEEKNKDELELLPESS